MSDASKPGILRPVMIAAAISLVVVVVRLIGEINTVDVIAGEAPTWQQTLFSRAAGGGGSPLGISWLAPLFGLWFGRRLAAGGHRPRATWQAIVLPLVAFALMMGTFFLLFVDPNATEPGTTKLVTAEEWRTAGMIFNGVTVILGLTVLIVWPRAWLALAAYGCLARIPVILTQFVAFGQQWGTHFEKGPPGMPAEVVPFALTLAQSTFWPLFWTPVAGCLCAAIGALTVRK
ncbi:MAG: hypothetical protein KDC98_12165 [Planctomycetes bacterium]|nr:hypothetical protein [Planctomycetota bacterium]